MNFSHTQVKLKESWLNGVDNNNFHEDKEDLGGIITAIDGKLNNLFS